MRKRLCVEDFYQDAVMLEAILCVHFGVDIDCVRILVGALYKSYFDGYHDRNEELLLPKKNDQA